MAKLDIEPLLQRIKQNGHDVWIAEPQSEKDVAALEAALQVRLPPSYHQFLLRYGAMSIYDTTISSIYYATTDARQEQGLPDYLIVVEPNDEAPYCFDTRYPGAAGEFPLSCYELYSGADGKIADDFPQFIVNWFLETWAEEE